MNDVLAMMLCVLGDEADAHWAFTRFMAAVETDFVPEGMMRKVRGDLGVGVGPRWAMDLLFCVGCSFIYFFILFFLKAWVWSR